MRSLSGQRRAPFARAAEEPFRRRPADAAKVLIATVVVVVTSRRSSHVSAVSLDVFHALNDLPGGLRPAVQGAYDLAALWVAALVAAAALVARRWRLARDLVLAGLLAWLASRGLALFLADGLHGLRAVVRTRTTPGFPDVRLTLATAVAATASPFLSRAIRRLSWLIVLALVPAELYLGVALPRSQLCALALGWGVAGVVLSTFGSPAGRPTPDQVAVSLVGLGIPVTDVELADPQPAAHTLVRARDAEGPVLVKVLGRDQTEAQLLGTLARWVWWRDPGTSLFLTRRQEVEHHAYLSLLARDAGVRVPAVLACGTGVAGAALLVERDVAGAALCESDDVDDATLDRVWEQVATLHGARLAHGSLSSRHVRLTTDGPTLVSLDHARAHPRPEALAADVAELLVTTAASFGVERAVGAALRTLGSEALATALPRLQPAAVTRAGRRVVADRGSALGPLCEELRTAVATATAVPEPELEQLARVRTTSLALGIGTAVGFAALLSSVGDPGRLARLVAHADPSLLALALAFGLATNIGFALAMLGSVRQRLPLWPTVQLQAAGSFSNLALPFGSQALQVRFLQRQGIDAATAVASGLVTLVGGTLAQVGVLALLLQTSPQHVAGVDLPAGTLVTLLEVVSGALVVGGLVVAGVPPLRRRMLPPLERGWVNVAGLLRDPRELGLLLGGSALATVLYGCGLAACAAALGAHPPLLSLIAANTGVTLVAALVPFPGGGTAVSSVGLSGAVLALGVPEDVAVGAVLLHQLLTTFAPALPGWLALRSLLRHDDL